MKQKKNTEQKYDDNISSANTKSVAKRKKREKNSLITREMRQN